jgi:hypothetical protein
MTITLPIPAKALSPNARKSADMKTSPTQLSLKQLRKTCDAVQVVEKWNPHARIRQDLFGFIDIIALRGRETIAVQSTSWKNVSSRVSKIEASPMAGAVREAGWSIIVHGWRKSAKTGRYEMREINLNTLPATT